MSECAWVGAASASVCVRVHVRVPVRVHERLHVRMHVRVRVLVRFARAFARGRGASAPSYRRCRRGRTAASSLGVRTAPVELRS
eukprot:3456194-Pleurochrysis_carterae.AAC.1